ncbi:MAG: hypothetical protein JXN65_07255 [Clostridia bacterium]|nr:hypothetical protein [Clostridia bacterium]
MLSRILCTIGSVITIGFGGWHFFVPKAYKWYSYMDENATELVVAVRAINVFFSLSLVLIGLSNIIFAYFIKDSKQGYIVLMAMSSVLWLVRVIMQIVYPQGSINPSLQYGMLASFIITFLLFTLSFIFAL